MNPKYLEELAELNLPTESYLIFGSSVLAVRDIRENNDIDVLITKELWAKLSKTLPINYDDPGRPLQYKHISLFKDLRYLDKQERVFQDKEIIDGIPYMSLEHLLEFKRNVGRAKDLEDVELIKKYLEQIRQP